MDYAAYLRRKAYVESEPTIKATRAHMCKIHLRLGYNLNGATIHADELLDRFFRRKKFTCLDRDEFRETWSFLWKAIRARYGYSSGDSRFERHWCQYREHYWINGEFVKLTEGERLRIARLHVLDAKLQKLERSALLNNLSHSSSPDEAIAASRQRQVVLGQAKTEAQGIAPHPDADRGAAAA